MKTKTKVVVVGGGVIGKLPVLFCTICMTGLVDMVEYLKKTKKEKDETK